jgi:hypothetical protein
MARTLETAPLAGACAFLLAVLAAVSGHGQGAAGRQFLVLIPADVK